MVYARAIINMFPLETVVRAITLFTSQYGILFCLAFHIWLTESLLNKICKLTFI